MDRLCLKPPERRAAVVFADPGNDIALNPVSVWELLVKHQTGTLPTTVPITNLPALARKDRLIRALPQRGSAVLKLPLLPMLNRDPVNRLLICQALDEGLTLLAPDEQVRAYDVPTLWD